MVGLTDWRGYGLPHCSVYVICPDNDWPCKVGVSVYAVKRLMQLQTSVWRPLKLGACFWFETVADARKVERKVHQMLSDDNKWLHGEWFDMRPKEAADMVQFAALTEGVECNDDVQDARIRSDLEANFNEVRYSDDVIAEITDRNERWFGNVR